MHELESGKEIKLEGATQLGQVEILQHAAKERLKTVRIDSQTMSYFQMTENWLEIQSMQCSTISRTDSPLTFASLA